MYRIHTCRSLWTTKNHHCVYFWRPLLWCLASVPMGGTMFSSQGSKPAPVNMAEERVVVGITTPKQNQPFLYRNYYIYINMKGTEGFWQHQRVGAGIGVAIRCAFCPRDDTDGLGTRFLGLYRDHTPPAHQVVLAVMLKAPSHLSDPPLPLWVMPILLLIRCVCQQSG